LGTAIGASILYFTTQPDVEEYALSCLGVFLALFLWGIITSILYLRATKE
jgi:Kef-type K+ transport system membrane component KefB